MVDLTPVDFLSSLGGLDNQPGSLGVQQQLGALQTSQLQRDAMTLQNQQQQKAVQRQTAFQADLANLSNNPDAGSIARMVYKYPEFADQVKRSHDIQDKAKQDSDFHIQSQIYSAASNGNFALAANLLQRHHDAAVAAGEPEDPTDLALITALNSNDPAEQKRAVGMIGMAVASVNPDKFNETYRVLNSSAVDKNHFTPLGDGRVLDQATGEVTGEARPKPEYREIKVTNPDGSETTQFVDINAGGGGRASGGGGSLPTSIPAIVDRIATIEGTGQNPRSSANGVGQFTNATWLSTYKSTHPATGLSDAQILQKRSDPDTARQMLNVLVQNNAQALSDAGIPATADHIYLANFLGQSGAIRALSAPPSTPINQVVSRAQIAANPETLGRFKSVGDLRQWSAGKMATGSANSGASALPGAVASYNTKPATGATDLVGPAFLASLPPSRQNYLKAVADGRIAAPKPGTKYGDQLAEQATNAFPDIDTTTFPARASARKDFTGNGKGAQNISALNRFFAHLNDAYDIHLRLGGANLGPLSGIAAGISQSFSPKDVRDYNVAIEGLQGEFQKLTKNGQGNESEAERLIASAKAAQSAEGRLGALQALAKLAAAQVEPLHDQWSAAFPERHIPIDITPASRAIYQNVVASGSHAIGIDKNGTPVVPKSYKAGASSVPTQTATNPQTGQKIGLIGGKWVPIK